MLYYFLFQYLVHVYVLKSYFVTFLYHSSNFPLVRTPINEFLPASTGPHTAIVHSSTFPCYF